MYAPLPRPRGCLAPWRLPDTTHHGPSPWVGRGVGGVTPMPACDRCLPRQCSNPSPLTPYGTYMHIAYAGVHTRMCIHKHIHTRYIHSTYTGVHTHTPEWVVHLVRPAAAATPYTPAQHPSGRGPSLLSRCVGASPVPLLLAWHHQTVLGDVHQHHVQQTPAMPTCCCASVLPHRRTGIAKGEGLQSTGRQVRAQHQEHPSCSTPRDSPGRQQPTRKKAVQQRPWQYNPPRSYNPAALAPQQP